MWNEAWINYGNGTADYYIKDQQQFKQAVCDHPSIIECMQSCYHVLLNKKLIYPIEEIETDLKKEIWQEAKAWCGTQSKEQAVKVSILIYTIANLLEMKRND